LKPKNHFKKLTLTNIKLNLLKLYLRAERMNGLDISGELILKKVTTATIQKKQPLDKPLKRWKDAVERDIQLVDVNASIELTFNRER
jgi:hypothetical protein